MENGTLAEWVSGVGTVAAVGLALFTGPVRARWKRPRLVLLDGVEPTDETAPLTSVETGTVVGRMNVTMGRLYVRNRGRGDRAVDAQVIVRSCHRLNGEIFDDFEMPLRFTHVDAPQQTIHARTRRLVDVVSTTPSWLTLAVATPPLNGRHAYSREPDPALNRWELDVELVAENVSPIYYCIRVETGPPLRVTIVRPPGRRFRLRRRNRDA